MSPKTNQPLKKPRTDAPQAAAEEDAAAVVAKAAAAAEPAAAAAAVVPVAPIPLPSLDDRPDSDAQLNMTKLPLYVSQRIAQLAKADQQLMLLESITPAATQGDSHLAAPQGPHHWKPLKIERKESMSLSSFKPPWTSVDAVSSLMKTGMFEASGNLFWVNPSIPGSSVDVSDWSAPDELKEHRIIVGTLPPWKRIKEMATEFFSRRSVQIVHAAPPPAPSQGDDTPVNIGRITFPTILAVYMDGGDTFQTQAQKDYFDASLPMLSGHAFVAAWYYAAFLAISQGDMLWLRSLVQAALTVTIHLRINLSSGERAVWTSQLSENHKAEALFADSFMAFSLKIILISKDAPNKLKMLTQLGIRFNGADISQTMMTGLDRRLSSSTKQTGSIPNRP